MASEVEDRLRAIADGGWDSFDGASKVVTEAAKQRRILEDARERETRRMVRAALTSEQGKALMAWLEANTILLPEQSDELNAVTAEAYAIAKARRAGMNAIIFKLRDMLAEPDDEEKQT